MVVQSSENFVYGWVSTANTRGTIDILYSSLSTIYLCTWSSICLNLPRPGPAAFGFHFLLYKLRWQLFAIFFPEVVVATAAEQWLSARQSVKAFAALGYSQWTIRHGFFADMGGIRIAPPDIEPFPVDSQQLAYLVEHKYIPMPQISIHDIAAANKADGFARAITLVQMAWFCLSCAGRGALHIGLSPLELTALAFIICTLHNFFFWYYKPMDPARPEILPMYMPIAQVCSDAGVANGYMRTPLDFVKPAPDPKSLVTPFWFGFGVVFEFGGDTGPKPVQTLANSKGIPAKGIGWGLTLYLILFQVMYYGLHIAAGWNMNFPSTVEWGLWTVSNFMDLGLIALYCLALPLGTLCAPFIGRVVFRRKASSILEVASMLPYWAKLLIHGPFVFVYIAARASILIESFISLRALPAMIYQDINWSSFLPHI